MSRKERKFGDFYFCNAEPAICHLSTLYGVHQKLSSLGEIKIKLSMGFWAVFCLSPGLGGDFKLATLISTCDRCPQICVLIPLLPPTPRYPVPSSVTGDSWCSWPLKWDVFTGQVRWGLSKVSRHTGLRSSSVATGCMEAAGESDGVPEWQWEGGLMEIFGREMYGYNWIFSCLRMEGEGGNRGWDGWMASLTQWTWVWANSGRWRRTGKPGVLQSTGLQRVRHSWETEQQQNPYLIFKEFSFCKWRQSSPTIEAKSQIFAFIVSTAGMRWACESDSTNQSLGYKDAETASKPHAQGRWEWCWDSAHGQISVVKVGYLMSSPDWLHSIWCHMAWSCHSCPLLEVPWWVLNSCFFFNYFYLFFCLFWVLVMTCELIAVACGMWHGTSSSLTRDWTCASCLGSAGCWLLDYEGSPWTSYLMNCVSAFHQPELVTIA